LAVGGAFAGGSGGGGGIRCGGRHFGPETDRLGWVCSCLLDEVCEISSDGW
jgi:hypothetical protein